MQRRPHCTISRHASPRGGFCLSCVTWFLIALLATFALPLAEVMNDHRAFLPYIGLVIAMAGAVSLLVNCDVRYSFWAKAAAAVTVGLFLCGNGYATFQRNKVWNTEETLWRDVTIKVRATRAD